MNFDTETEHENFYYGKGTRALEKEAVTDAALKMDVRLTI
jgi:hypothetical protein